MSNIRNRKALAVCAGLAFAFLPALVMAASSTHPGSEHARKGARKTITFDMPACPIQAKTVPPTKTPFQLPPRNLLGEPLSVTGTVQVTDQTGSTVFLIAPTLGVDDSGISFARTVKTLQHATGSVTFDKGCTKTDPYGSNNCHWDWGQQVTMAHQSALQEDITDGKLIVDLNVNSTPFQFSCAVCGAPCTVQIPPELDCPPSNRIWTLVVYMFGRHH